MSGSTTKRLRKVFRDQHLTGGKRRWRKFKRVYVRLSWHDKTRVLA